MGGMNASPASTVSVSAAPLDPREVVAVARDGVRIQLAPEALAALAKAREVIDELAASGEPVYGVSTGFGALATRYIDPEMRAQLQRSLVRSHAAGSGPEVEREVVRALMLLRLRTLASGHTGADDTKVTISEAGATLRLDTAHWTRSAEQRGGGHH